MKYLHLLFLFIFSQLAFPQIGDDWMPFKADNNTYKITENQKENIVNAYGNLAPGNWLTITNYKNLTQFNPSEVQARNRAILSFLKSNDFDSTNIMLKYDKFEQIWLFKPYIRGKVNRLSPKTCPVQIFEIDNSKTSTVKTKFGNILKFPSFVFNSMGHKIRIEVQEFNSKAKLLSAGIPTHVGKNIGELKMVLNVKAFEGDTELSIRKGSSFSLKFETKNKKSRMISMYGRVRGETLDWNPNQNQKFKNRSLSVPVGDFTKDEGSYPRLMINYLLGNFSQTGWIGCGYQVENIGRITTKVFNVKNLTKEASAYLVATNKSVILPLEKTVNGAFYSNRIPENIDFQFVAIQNEGLNTKLVIENIDGERNNFQFEPEIIQQNNLLKTLELNLG